MERDQKVVYTEEGFLHVAEALTEYPEDQRIAILSVIVNSF